MATEERCRRSSPTMSFLIDQKPQLTKYTFTCAILSSMPSILVGLYSGNSISKAWSVLMEDLKLGTGKLLFFFLIFAILCPMASLAAGTTSDWIGRRYTLLFSLVAFFFGSLFTNLAPNAAVFFSSWVLVTIAVGCARTVIPVYITELSPESTQGFLTCFVNVFENTGSFTRESFGLRLVTTHCSATELETRFNRNDPFVSFGSGCSFLLARVTELARVSWKTQ